MSNIKELPKEIQDRIEIESDKEQIYEPKYGGKDRSGYNTMMLYEVNGERAECYERGATAWAKIAIGFAEWLKESNWGEKETWGKHDPPSYPTMEQLLSIYLKTLPQ